MLFAVANDEHESPLCAWVYLAHGDAMPDCVGEGEGEAAVGVPAALDDAGVAPTVGMVVDAMVLGVGRLLPLVAAGAVELLEEMAELLDTPVSLPSPPPR